MSKHKHNSERDFANCNSDFRENNKAPGTEVNAEVPCSENTTDNESNNASEVELVEQIAALKDALLRKTAETENLRKRLEKEKEEAVQYANKNFAHDLLSVLDNFERINESLASLQEQINESSHLKAYFEGISICEKELLSVFKKYGVSKIEVSLGDPFNHEYHQAMCEVEDSNYSAGTVAKLLQTGYMYHDRLLRPAMVGVSKKK